MPRALSLSAQLLALAAALGLGGSASAQITNLDAYIDGLQEVPPTPSPGTGKGFFVLDQTAHTLTFCIDVAMLTGPDMLAHIHGPAGVGVNGAILFSLPLGFPKMGVLATTPAQEANLLGGLTYVNIHTAAFGGGEVRGQIFVSGAVGVSSCDPGAGGVIACPCANPPAGPGQGCDNSSATGGAVLSARGTPKLSADTLVFTTTGEKPTATSIVLQGDAPSPGGLVFGQGIRCVGGSLKRLYVKGAVGGSITAPICTDASVSGRSATLGAPIPAGAVRDYMVYYRDPIVLGGCPAASTFNGTQMVSITWAP